jgi:hypothetical protein
MTELELTRRRDDRRVYEVDGVGTLRVGGLFSRAATAEAGGRSWTFDRRGFWSRTIEASDATGAVVGSFDPRTIRRGGTLRWGGRELVLQPASNWRERYALLDGERELALLDGKGWGKRPVSITVDDLDAVEPGLLLFAVFLVRRLAEDADAAATVTVGGASGPG